MISAPNLPKSDGGFSPFAARSMGSINAMLNASASAAEIRQNIHIFDDPQSVYLGKDNCREPPSKP